MSGMLFIFTACTLWAVDTLIRYPLLNSGVSATQIVVIEHLFLCLTLLIWHARSLKGVWTRLRPHGWALLLIGGLGSALGTLAFTQAFSHINPTLVILLQKLQPIVAITAASVVLGERWKPAFPALALLAIIGSLLMILPDVMSLGAKGTLSGYSGQRDTLLGYGLTLLAVFGWGLSTVFGRRLCNDGVVASELMLGRFAAGALVLLPLALIQSREFSPVDADTLQKIAAMALLAGLLGMAFYYRGLQRLPAHIATLCELFFPVAAVAINWWWLDQHIGPHHAAGAVALTAAAVIAQRKQ